MAINPSAAYPGQIDTTDPIGYPYGAARNDVVIGDGQGTPLEQGWVKDLFGFHQALLSAAAIVPSGTPEKVGASQYLTALKRLFSSPNNWPERATFTNSSTVNSSVLLAYDPASSQGYQGNTGIWMACTQNTLSITSDDGALWRNGVSFGGILLGAAFDLAAGSSSGVRSFLASRVGSSSLMRTIDAGTTWTLLGATVPINSVLCNGPGSFWVAAGDTGLLKHSTDGITWTTAGQTVPGAWLADAKRVVWNGTIYCVLPSTASSNKVLTSPDGLVWTVRSLPAVATWAGLAYSSVEGLWMATAVNGAIATSPDGFTWSSVSGTGATGTSDLACVGSCWVATIPAGNFGGISYSTDRGQTWSQISVGDHRAATSGWSRIIAGDKRFLVAHASGSAIEFALSQRGF